MWDRCTPIPGVTLAGVAVFNTVGYFVSSFLSISLSKDIIYASSLACIIGSQWEPNSEHWELKPSHNCTFFHIIKSRRVWRMKLVRTILLASILASVEAFPLSKAVTIVDRQGQQCSLLCNIVIACYETIKPILTLVSKIWFIQSFI
jgi:hypothetical protein